VILAALPLPTGLIGAVLERVLPPLFWWLGAAVARFGEALLIRADAPATAPTATLRGDLMVAAGAVCAAAGHRRHRPGSAAGRR